MDGNNCAGLLDMIDIAYSISKVSPDDISLNENMLRSLEIAGRAIALEEVGAILNESQRDPFVPVFLSNKASMAVDLFATGIHRVPLRDADDNLVGSLSQTDVVNYLEKLFSLQILVIVSFLLLICLKIKVSVELVLL